MSERFEDSIGEAFDRLGEVESSTLDRVRASIHELPARRRRYWLAMSLARLPRPGRVALSAASIALVAAVAAALWRAPGQAPVPSASARATIPGVSPSAVSTASAAMSFRDPGGSVYRGPVDEMQRLDATSGWALVGSLSPSYLMFTDDAGATWRDGTPAGMVTNPWIELLDADHGWMVQSMAADPRSTSLILRTSDGGRDWTSSALPVRGYAWAAISFVTPEVGYLVVTTTNYPKSQTTVYATADGGSTWRRVGAIPGDWQFWPPNAPLVFFTPDDGLFVSGTALRTHDGGKTWTAIDLPPRPADVPAGANVNVSDLVVGGGVALISVQFHWPTTGGFFTYREFEYLSRDLGQTWSLAWPGGCASPCSAVLIDARTWLRFDQNPGQTAFDVTHDGGTSWTSIVAAIPSGMHFVAESFTSAMDGWAILARDPPPCPENASGCGGGGGGPGDLAETSDGGLTWTVARTR